jgi:hypothetical protein
LQDQQLLEEDLARQQRANEFKKSVEEKGVFAYREPPPSKEKSEKGMVFLTPITDSLQHIANARAMMKKSPR